MPLCYGGGIRSLEDIRKIFSIGVEKVAVNTYAVENPQFIQRAADSFGSQSIVAAMDVKKTLVGDYKVCTHSGTKTTDVDPVTHAVQMAAMGCGEIFLNSVDRDGTLSGYDIDLIRKVVEAVSIPVITSGGAGSLADFADAVNNGGASAVAAGSLFVFHGKHRAVLISYPSRRELEETLK
jgi:cyclase